MIDPSLYDVVTEHSQAIYIYRCSYAEILSVRFEPDIPRHAMLQ